MDSQVLEEEKVILTRFTEITLEFLCVAFHNILYHSGIYPASIFETRRKYNIVVYQSIQPDINSYIELVLKNIEECLMKRAINCIEFALTDSNYLHIKNILFNFEKKYSKVKPDEYVIDLEQNIRSVLLKLSSASGLLKEAMPEDACFCILIHTNNNTKVSMSLNPDLYAMPMVEHTPNEAETVASTMVTLAEDFGRFESETQDQLHVYLQNSVDSGYSLLKTVMLTF